MYLDVVLTSNENINLSTATLTCQPFDMPGLISKFESMFHTEGGT